jgi:hypothetical protein
MSYDGFDAYETASYGGGGYTDVSTIGDDLGTVDVTPGLTLPTSDYNSTQNSSGGIDWMKLIPEIGTTFAQTYSAVNHPGAVPLPPSGSGMPSDYHPPTTGTTPPATSGFSASQLMNFQTPYPYLLIGGAVLFVVAMRRK